MMNMKMYRRPPHPQEVWNYLQETAEILRTLGKATDRKFQETNREINELRVMSQESDRKFREMSEESNRKFREMSEETKQALKEVTQQLGKIGNRLGEFVEEMVLPSALHILQERGIQVEEIYHRAQSKRRYGGAEIDLLLVNTTEIVATEVKSTLSIADVNEHQKRLERFKVLFPHLGHLDVYGAVAGMVVKDPVARYAVEQGFFVMIPSANTMQLFNDQDFHPKKW